VEKVEGRRDAASAKSDRIGETSLWGHVSRQVSLLIVQAPAKTKTI